MELYLRECKENLQRPDLEKDKTILIVLGNEACDLDSAVSSIVYAYFLKQTTSSADIIIPVLNVKRAELRIHSEVTFFLEETSISLEDIICKDEINIRQFVSEDRLQIALVDHNVLSDADSYLEQYVVDVVDHHAFEQPERLEKCSNKIIEPVGSCATLIARKILTTNPSLIDPQIAMLLYGTILLDTVCLEESAKRVTDDDRDVISKLENLLEGLSREEVFQALQNAKFDISGLTPVQLLQKDLKVISTSSLTVAISSIPTLIEAVLKDCDMQSALSKYSVDNQYCAVVLMGCHISKNGKSVQRQIAVFSSSEDILKKLCDFLKNQESPSLQLEPISSSAESLQLFEQKNTALTRKFVLPAVRNFLNEAGCIKENGISEKLNCSGDCEPDVEGILDPLCTQDIDSYHVETLDVPDSPSHISLSGASAAFHDAAQAMISNTGESANHFADPNGASVPGGQTVRKVIPFHPLELSSDAPNDDQKSLSSLSNKSDNDVFSPTEDIVLPEDDDIDTPEELNSDNSMGMESSWSEPIPEMSAAEEYEEERSWKTCLVSGEERRVDMKVIDPYKKVLSHGGYHGDNRNAIIIFSACYLPDRSRKDYDYVMDNLFLYVLSSLDQLVAEDYILVYLHGATERGNMPSFGWLKRCYQMIDRRLRKNLKGLYLVHPTFWLKTIMIMTRPFISSKFSRKLKFVNNLDELSSLIPMDHVCIPDKVKIFDERLLES